MGFINRFNLERIIRDYNTPYFIETGTFWGDAVAYALTAPFKKIYSIELIPEIAEVAKDRFTAFPNVEIIVNSSALALSELLPQVDGNCIFWLDAHFPGSDAGLTKYTDTEDEEIRLPLKKELEVIYNLRKDFQDIIIMDDLRIYEEGDFEKGNVPEDAMPREKRGTEFIFDKYGMNRKVLKSYRDEGYVVVLPERKYYNGILPKKFFAKKTRDSDFYYAGEIVEA